MNTQSNAMPGSLDAQRVAPAVLSPSRPMYWSIRRELWENRSIYVAPLIVAGVFLFGFLISLITLPRRMNTALALDAAKQRETVRMPFSVIVGLLVMTAFVIGVFYCLDALYGERRDRSILFWKSLPISDRTTVLAKASIPMAVFPLFIFSIAIATRLIMLLLATLTLMHDGRALAALWTHVTFFE